MDQYLKDSPSDYNLYYEDSTNQNGQPQSNSIDFNSNFDEEDLYPQNNQNTFGNNTGNDPFTDSNGDNQQNNFSLNIEQPYTSQIDDIQFPGIPGTEFINNADDYSTSVNNEPFLDELDNLNYPTETHNHIGLGSPYNNVMINPSNNLDELISPHNYNNNNQYLDSQYFSPPQAQRLNFNSFQPSSSALSPDVSRHGSVSIPVQTTNNFSGSYLSPQTNSFMSPNGTSFNNSFDTLTSPNYESYLNSPPQHSTHQRNISASLMSSSIPNSANNYLSPPTNSNMLGTSAPNQSDQSYNSVNDDAPSRELTKEEKLKRRKKFHNEVERRRRDLIKSRIKELSQLVPPSLLNPQLVAVQTLKNSKLNTEEINDLLASVKVKESKPNKNTILNKSVVYVKHLQYVIQEQERATAELELKLLSLQVNDSQETKPNANFMEDFNQAQSQFIKEEDNFDPDEFFSEIITGNEQSNDKLNF